MSKNYIKGMMFAALFAALTAAVSPIKIPLGFTPVPITLQTLMVLLSGALLGAYLGALSQFLYLLVGALGLPVFAGGSFGLGAILGPTGGYLMSYPIAAFVVGFIYQKRNKAVQYISAGLIGCLMLIAYTDLIFNAGIMKYGKATLVSLMTFGQRMAFVFGSLAVIAIIFYLTFYLHKKKKIEFNSVFAMFAGTIVIYAFGASYGKLITGLGWAAVFIGWVLPFIIGDSIKLMVAAYIANKADAKRYCEKLRSK